MVGWVEVEVPYRGSCSLFPQSSSMQENSETYHGQLIGTMFKFIIIAVWSYYTLGNLLSKIMYLPLKRRI